jgi:hypothetical protein
MADDKGNALSPDLLPPQRPHGSTAHDAPGVCVGCGAHHGSVNALRVCHENTIRALRAAAARSTQPDARDEEIKRLRDVVSRLAPTHGGFHE